MTIIIVLVLAGSLTGIANAQRPHVPFSDEAVQKAIDKGVEFLLGSQGEDGSWPPFIVNNGQETYPVGPTAMATYALLAKGMSVKDPKIEKALKWLVAHDSDKTYEVGFKCQAWLAALKQDAKYRKYLEADVKKLLESQENGGYHYKLVCDPKVAWEDTLKKPETFVLRGCNSNSQYGVLGVWAGYRANMEIPKQYWEKVAYRWVKCFKNGSWTYLPNDIPGDKGQTPTHTLASAGMASLYICADALMGDAFIKCSVTIDNPITKTIGAALKWFDVEFEKSLKPGGLISTSWGGAILYHLYGVERVGLASGRKHFGTTDWYKAGAEVIINRQQPDGSCGEFGPHVGTSYALLFLVRGQRGVLFNRLEYDGDWNNRPRALYNFCRWAEGVYEQEVNWQIITLKTDVDEWHDAAVLAISGSKAPKFSDEDIAKLRTYVYQGGMIFSITECGGVMTFGKGMKEAYRKIFPKYEMNRAGKEHELYSCQYKLPGVPAFYIVSNGIRPLAIHTDADLPLSWQTYAVATGKPNFEAAANVLMYVSDKQLKNRGANLWPEEPAKAPSRSIKVARIRFAGNYDPEPLALQRLSRQLARQYDLRLEFADSPASAPAGGTPQTGLAPTELNDGIRIGFMTGTGAFTLNAQDKEALKSWVEGGGLLVMDAAGAAKGFADSAKDLIGELWGADSLLPLPLDSPVYQLKDMTIDKVKYRRATRARISGIKDPRLQAVLAGDRPKVLLSTEDLTGGLIGYSVIGMDGYEPSSAFELMRNICIYVATPKAAASKPAGAPK
ncbi:MAG: DUF4159 domain-containing protein [Planctomycetes bacterium]|nr:DUF4159 domain-containing protein [Planctomycetota bacterium]